MNVFKTLKLAVWFNAMRWTKLINNNTCKQDLKLIYKPYLGRSGAGLIIYRPKARLSVYQHRCKSKELVFLENLLYSQQIHKF